MELVGFAVIQVVVGSLAKGVQNRLQTVFRGSIPVFSTSLANCGMAITGCSVSRLVKNSPLPAKTLDAGGLFMNFLRP
jgi:hypothetical protein